MAHYTGMKALQNSVHKSGADISAKNLFTAKVGELLPVYWDLGIPNRTYRINIDYFTRTRPVNTAAYTRVREYFDFYAVPIDLLWKSFDNSVIQMGDVNPTQSKSLTEALTTNTDLPWCTLSDLSYATLMMNSAAASGDTPEDPRRTLNMFGFNKGDLLHKLLTYLNYGNYVDKQDQVGDTSNRWWNFQTPSEGDFYYSQRYAVNCAVNILPLLAYQKIYQDFFRWSQWENADPTSYNVDWFNGEGNIFGDDFRTRFPEGDEYWKRENMFSLRYANWHKDLFMGMLPNSQFGDIAVVDVLPPDPVNVVAPVHFGESDDYPVYTATQFSSPDGSTAIKSTSSDVLFSENTRLSAQFNTGALQLRSQFSVLALRQAEALQKWREISQSVDTNYRDQIKAHFGVNVPYEDSHMCQYIGGIARNLDISEVLNTNLDAAESQAYIYGKGIGSGNGSMTYKTGACYCILMCIYHAVPLLDYDLSGQDGQLLVTSTEDLPIPEFDNIGMEAVPMVQLANSTLIQSTYDKLDFIGYNPRYYNWKTKIDRIHGAFTTSLRDWVAPIDNSYLIKWFAASGNNSYITWQFFKVNPNTLDNIFQILVDSTWNTDQLLINCNIDCRVVNPLSADGMPY